MDFQGYLIIGRPLTWMLHLVRIQRIGENMTSRQICLQLYLMIACTGGRTAVVIIMVNLHLSFINHYGRKQKKRWIEKKTSWKSYELTTHDDWRRIRVADTSAEDTA